MRGKFTGRRSDKLPSWLLLALVTAAVLPLVLFIALQAAFSAEAQRSGIEQAAIDRTRRMITSVDARLERTRGAAAALVTTRSVFEADWPAAYQRAKEIADQNPDWDAVIIWNRDTGREVVNTTYQRRPERPVQQFDLDVSRVGQPSDLVIGGIVGGEHCPCIYAHTAAGARYPYILTVRLRPAVFQDIIEREGRGAIVVTLIDAQGRTIARTANAERHIGRPEAPSVRAVPATGHSGVYTGDTLEGRASFSAYSKSRLSGWSVHLALEPAAFEGTQFRWAAASVIAALASLTVAGAIITLSIRNFAAQRRIDKQTTESLRAEAAAQLAVARDLHDGVLQFLTGLSLRFRSLRQSVSTGAADAAETDRAFEALEGEVRREQRELRRFIENLGPTLKDADYAASLSATALLLSRRWAVRVQVSPDDADSMVPHDLRRDIEFILREAVSNAVRHGGAQKITLNVARSPDELHLEIRDDGSGFATTGSSVTALPATIKSRVIQHGGTMDVHHDNGAVLNVRLRIA